MAPTTLKAPERPPLLIGLGITLVCALTVYIAAYALARTTHLLVRTSPMCDADHVAPGAGAPHFIGTIFAPLIATENVYYLFLDAYG